MTARKIWEALLIELSKVNAPSMLLSDFNYFLNKAINLYINRRCNIYDINLQTTDDLRVLKATAKIKVSKSKNSNYSGDTYECNLPLDYLHLLNCICEYKVAEGKTYKCKTDGLNFYYSATKLTADSWPKVMSDYYMRPLPERPYFYIHNVNSSEELPTNPINPVSEVNSDGTMNPLRRTTTGTDPNKLHTYTIDNDKETGTSNLPRTINIKNLSKNISLVDKEPGFRYGNATNVRIEIRCGNSNKLKLDNILVDYIKTPQYVELTLTLINLIRDTSQIMEFPDYVCLEIINELVLLVMNNIGDPRLQTLALVTLSIAPPVQQLTQSEKD